MLYTLKNEKMTYTFSDMGGELISAKSADGVEYMWRGVEAIWEKHAPLLFPFCGRLLGGKYTYGGEEFGYKSHGFVSKSLLTVSNLSEKSISFTISQSEQTKEIYPFDFRFTVTYTADENLLRTDIKIENLDSREMIYMFGGHPGFSTDINPGADFNDYRIEMGVNEAKIHKLIHDSYVNPVGESFALEGGELAISNKLFEDDATATMIFKDIPHKLRLYTDKGSRAIEFEYSEKLDYLCVWKFIDEGADYVCLEPWTSVPSDECEPVSLENRRTMRKLAPATTESYFYSVTFI